MKCQKLINFLVNAPNQPSKCRTNIWVELNDGAREKYNTESQIKLKLQC